jgi:hypothetical protein
LTSINEPFAALSNFIVFVTVKSSQASTVMFPTKSNPHDGELFEITDKRLFFAALLKLTLTEPVNVSQASTQITPSRDIEHSPGPPSVPVVGPEDWRVSLLPRVAGHVVTVDLAVSVSQAVNFTLGGLYTGGIGMTSGN